MQGDHYHSLPASTIRILYSGNLYLIPQTIRMKKLLIFITALLYFAGSTGASLNIHYCMGRAAGWDAGFDQHNNCRNCGMEKKSNGCCKDQHRFIKMGDDQQYNGQVTVKFEQQSSPEPIPFFGFTSNDLPVILPASLFRLTYPPPYKIAVYLRNRVFRL